MTIMFKSRCDRLHVYNCRSADPDIDPKDELRHALTDADRSVPSKYFYDAKGSMLFEEICRLPEYYQTRTELALIKRYGKQIMEGLCDCDLVELGSGANWKIRALMDSAANPDKRFRYVPVDISDSALISASEELLEIYPELDIMGLIADFHSTPARLDNDRQKIFIFLGSTLGNMDATQSGCFFENVARMMSQDDRFVLGVDLVKPVKTLEAAYNDRQGVTAQFNKNILNVINAEFDADFDPDAFDHLALFNHDKRQIEMRLVANKPTQTRIQALEMNVAIDEGENIRTEICRKFTRSDIEKMADRAGLGLRQWFTDKNEWFALAVIARK